jgi:hypothetical protein
MVLAKTLLVARNIDDLAILVEENRPNMEQTRGNARGHEHPADRDEIATIGVNVLGQNAADRKG